MGLLRTFSVLISLLLAIGGCDESNSGLTETVDSESSQQVDAEGGVSSSMPDTAQESDSEESVETVENEVSEADAGPSSDTVTREEAQPSFLEKGNYRAGFRQYSVTYDLPGLEEPRTIDIGVWYPTEDTEGETIRWGGVLKEEDLFVNASVVELKEGERFPVRAYTHGNMGLMSDSSNTSEFFASHGWVTIAPNHTGNTLLDFIDPRPPWMFYARARDMKEALDYMTALDESEPLAGKMNLDEMVLMGHSYGGFTGYGLVGAEFDYEGIESACTGGEGPLNGPCTPEQLAEFAKSVKDPRFVAYAPLDGGNPDMYGAAGAASVDVPMLQMYAIEPEAGVHKGSETFWNWLQDKSIVRVGIQDGCHIGFTLGFCPGISDEEGYRIIHSYLLAFSQHVLLGETSEAIKSLMQGEYSISENVVFEMTDSAETYWKNQ